MSTFTTDTKTFKAAISTFRNVTGITRANVHVTIDAAGMTLQTAGGADTPARIVIPGKVDGGAYSHTVNWTDLSKASNSIKAIKSVPPVVTFTDEGITVAARSTVALEIIESGSEVPDLMPVSVYSATALPADVMHAARGAVYAASTDRTLPMLTGIRIAGDEAGVEVTSTDRFRLVYATAAGADREIDAVIPAAAVKASTGGAAVYTTAGVKYPDQWVTVETSGGTLTTSAIDADFPNVKPLFPKSVAGAVDVDRRSLLEVMRLANGLGMRNAQVQLDWHGTARAGVSSWDFEVKAVHGTAHCPAVNPSYMQDALASMTADTVRIFIQAPYSSDSVDRPIVMMGGDSVSHLLMPVRLPDDEVAAAVEGDAAGVDSDGVIYLDSFAPAPAAEPAPRKAAPRKAAKSKTPAPAPVAPAPVDPAPVDPAPVDPAPADLVSFEFKGVRISAPAPVWEEQIPAACGWLAMHNETWFATFQDATGGRLRRAFTKLKATGLFEVATV